MQDFILSRREEIAELCCKHYAQRLAIFGSAVRDDFDPTRSGVDVLVDFASDAIPAYIDHYVGLRSGLEFLFQRPVDLLQEGVIRNPYRLRSIQEDQVELYAA